MQLIFLDTFWGHTKRPMLFNVIVHNREHGTEKADFNSAHKLSKILVVACEGCFASHLHDVF